MDRFTFILGLSMLIFGMGCCDGPVPAKKCIPSANFGDSSSPNFVHFAYGEQDRKLYFDDFAITVHEYPNYQEIDLYTPAFGHRKLGFLSLKIRDEEVFQIKTHGDMPMEDCFYYEAPYLFRSKMQQQSVKFETLSPDLAEGKIIITHQDKEGNFLKVNFKTTNIKFIDHTQKTSFGFLLEKDEAGNYTEVFEVSKIKAFYHSGMRSLDVHISDKSGRFKDLGFQRFRGKSGVMATKQDRGMETYVIDYFTQDSIAFNTYLFENMESLKKEGATDYGFLVTKAATNNVIQLDLPNILKVYLEEEKE